MSHALRAGATANAAARRTMPPSRQDERRHASRDYGIVVTHEAHTETAGILRRLRDGSLSPVDAVAMRTPGAGNLAVCSLLTAGYGWTRGDAGYLMSLMGILDWSGITVGELTDAEREHLASVMLE